MKSRARFPVLALVVSCLTLPACDEKKSEEKQADSAETEPGDGTVAGKADTESANDIASAKAPLGGEVEAARRENDGAVTGPACLPGKWHYDFADDALETMMKNLPKAKVTKEEGEAICEIERSANVGKLTCTTAGGKPVIVEVSAAQAGMPLAISMKMSGKTITQFKLLDDKSLELASDGLGDMKVDVTATLAGKEFPFPATELLNTFGGKAGATSDFECRGDELKVRPRVAGHSSWQVLKRMN